MDDSSSEPPSTGRVSTAQFLQDLNTKALECMNADPANGVALLREGLCTAEAGDDLSACQEEQAACLLTLGRLQLKLADYGHALNSFAQALHLFELNGQPGQVALSRSFIGIAYGYMGEYDKSMEYLFESLHEARGTQDALLVAEVLNDISYCYVLLDQPDMAIPLLDECIPTLRQINDPMSLSWALDTLASAYIAKGDYARGLEIEEETIHLAQSVQSWEDLTDYYTKVGKVHREQGDLDAAERAFQQALSVSQAHKLKNGLSQVLLEIGSLFLQQGKVADSIRTTREAVEIAAETNRKTDLIEGYLALSRGYEMTGDLAQALEYYKAYHTASQDLFNEDADRRLKNLQVMFQLDTAQREAETFQQQNRALKDEIEAQKCNQLVLEQLARTDPLTNTLNRRAFFEQGQKLFQHAIDSGGPLTVIMLDLDHFKEVNDHYGHIIGDQVLSAVVERIHQNMRAGDYLARYGGEEFIVIMPDLSRQMAFVAAERIRKGVERVPFLVQRDVVKITVSLGVAAIAGDTPINSFRDLVQQADQALYASKNKGRNCTSLFRKGKRIARETVGE
jgi:diguanylate cyclase (GGDEF)-like protein